MVAGWGAGWGGVGDQAARAVTHPGIRQGVSPKFFVTQKVNRRPGLPPAHPQQTSPPPPGQMGQQVGGRERGEKGRLCKGKQKRQRDIKRQETRGD